MKRKITEEELKKIKDLALFNYKEKSNNGHSADAFWGKCVLEAVISALKLDLKVEYMHEHAEKD